MTAEQANEVAMIIIAIKMLRARLKALPPSRENALAITKLDEAFLWLCAEAPA